MKSLFLSLTFLFVCNVAIFASQVNSRDALVATPQQQEQSANHSSVPESKLSASGSDDSGQRAPKHYTVNSLPTEVVEKSSPALENPVLPAPNATSVYRVGIGDVLDIQILNSPVRESTLYSVLAGGLIEYPLAGEAFRIQGLTTEEISSILKSKIKIYDNPKVVVGVREYASHNVIITGLVRDPGTKALRREAVPLYVILAEAQLRSDAARAIIMRTGSATQLVDITDTSATSILIYPNDIIRLIAAPPPSPLFYYVAGQVGMPGQRDFHSGMTLTQSIFASGGVTRNAGDKVKVMRQAPDGRLVSTEYNRKRIEQGKDPDPQIEAGDRIEVSRSNW